jgi:hypothetical protein
MSDYKINKVRAKALQSGVLKEDPKTVSEKMKELKPFEVTEIAGRPNAQFLNKKQRGYGIK